MSDKTFSASRKMLCNIFLAGPRLKKSQTIRSVVWYSRQHDQRDRRGTALGRSLLRLLSLTALLAAFGLPSVAQADPDSWTGTWQTYWRDGGAILRLQQRGSTVLGTYPLYEGSIEGSVEGRELRGSWSQIGGSGEFTFALSPDGKSFMGRFDNGEWWTGKRLASATDYEVGAAVLTSPRETLRSFVQAGNAAREGFIESIRPALDAIDFSDQDLQSTQAPDSPLLPAAKIDYARQLFFVLSTRLSKTCPRHVASRNLLRDPFFWSSASGFAASSRSCWPK
jgi:hypothetical protein